MMIIERTLSLHTCAWKGIHQNVNSGDLEVKRFGGEFYSVAYIFMYYLKFLNEQLNITPERTRRDTTEAWPFPGSLSYLQVGLVLPS